MSSSSKCPWTLFNRKLLDFIDDLQSVLGHVSEFTMFASTARLLSQIQPRQNQDIFDRFVATPYGAMIASKDEAFLLEEDFSTVAGSGSNGIVSLLKSVWRSLPPEDRDSIWAHMQVLVVINDRCHASA